MQLAQVPAGFRLELFAQEPDIGKPIAMNWDEQGRLWIIETVAYPNSIRGQADGGDDRILICADTDGDGKADEFTVFADGLTIPTSFTFTHGGVLVAQAPHFLFLKDLDGDDVADTREVVMTGWGVFDTHAGPSNLQYGIDNKLWGTVGYSGFEGDIEGEAVSFGQGIFRFDTDVAEGVRDFEYLAPMSNNTWGLGFSEEFDVFASCTNNEHSVFLGIPDRYFRAAGLPGRGTENIAAHYQIHPIVDDLHQLDVKGGFTAATGHHLYTARSFPSEYWNTTAFICEPTGRLIHRHILQQDGSGFVELGDGKNILASSDNWFTPVEAKVGPDGALWVLDWYNLLVQHTPEGQDATQSAGRDLFRGRIYRLVHEQGKATAMLDVSADDTASLLQALQSDNMFWRLTAQRLIVQHQLDGLADELVNLIQQDTVDAINTNGPALHAIWTLAGLGLLDGNYPQYLDAVTGALNHKAAGVRKAAIQALPVSKPAVAEALLASGVLEDPDKRVRLAACLALMEAEGTVEIGAAIFRAADQSENANDKWMAKALALATRVHHRVFSAAYASHFDSVAGPASDEKEVGTVDQVIQVRAQLGKLLYDKPSFVVKAGSTVTIVFSNPNYMQHNLVIVKPGTLDRVRDAAERLARERQAPEHQYIPDTEDVLFATALVDPNRRAELTFVVPSSPGSYPFLCTFPGQGETMYGTMEVVAE
ncbi:PVC-type heme-binding CxxCH protein [Parapedobacter sp. 2B3]|uniref:PVC-type heme-binding CxxCH protein n=1 Tax=Parapedobacter sp. 2B3 TaxID=3342381 RepID=UPI0035B666FC